MLLTDQIQSTAADRPLVRVNVDGKIAAQIAARIENWLSKVGLVQLNHWDAIHYFLNDLTKKTLSLVIFSAYKVNINE